MRFALLAVILASANCGDSALTQHTEPKGAASQPAMPATPELVGLDIFYSVFSDDRSVFDSSLETIERRWRDGYAIMLLELASFLPRDRGEKIFDVLRKRAGGTAKSHDDLLHWVWKIAPKQHPEYARFKEVLYSQIDSRFAAYFDNSTESTRIRLDEVRWGGVKRDGIPPLKNPKMIAPHEALYLMDDNVVFGLEVNGDARAYPKRILAWHEMFKDTVGGESVNGVYCTLCGSMILYKATHEGKHYELGTSGFLYRSNKLMYDHATESMWSTIRGEPVIGPLVGKGITLETLSVVTTTWGEWRKRHPKTTVLSLDTGHERNYDEGAAYREYFATDELMFTVPKRDSRLKNKAEILALRFGGESTKPTALAAEFLSRNPIYQNKLGSVPYLVLTDPSGANRVYEGSATRWKSGGKDRLVDDQGNSWRVTEAALVGPGGKNKSRLSAHRAFWFGWHAAHPDTDLIH